MNLISFHDDDNYPRLKIRLQERILCKMFSEITNEIYSPPYAQDFFQTKYKITAMSLVHIRKNTHSNHVE